MRVTFVTVNLIVGMLFSFVDVLEAAEAAEEAALDDRHLPAPKLMTQNGQRRRNAFDDIFIDIGNWAIDIGDVFVSGWDSMETFFSEDMVHWFEEDFVNFWEDVGESFAYAAEQDWEDFKDFGEWTGEQFNSAWDATLNGMESAWEWTEDTAVTAWSETEDFFQMLGCVVEDWTSKSCISCVKDACNSSLSEELLGQIDAANGVAVADMNNEFEAMYNGCASAMESCPTRDVCNDLYNLPASTQMYLQPQIAQCNLCYQCLPYGSTQEGCQAALDQLMPNKCADCSENELQMYQAFYMCSGLEVLHTSIEDLGESYAEGASGRESLDELCKYCANCSDYREELREICTEWVTIKQGWDCQPPAIPDVLVPPGVNV